MGIVKKGGGIFGIPGGEVTTDNPDGVSVGSRHSLYDARFVCDDGRSYGAFPMDNDLGFTAGEDRSNAGVTTPKKY